ncbi:MAG: 2-dehydropantoate 2-reductase N-terminal domain-containing protein, partial [Eubacteriales bacterium]|nr:2-dehydropantoate 2-reductase N-terminal domain-containing protein [Eubacteriales bacterium]
MVISVIGCGRWGSFIAWYLDRCGNKVYLYGRSG